MQELTKAILRQLTLSMHKPKWTLIATWNDEIKTHVAWLKDRREREEQILRAAKNDDRVLES